MLSLSWEARTIMYSWVLDFAASSKECLPHAQRAKINCPKVHLSYSSRCMRQILSRSFGAREHLFSVCIGRSAQHFVVVKRDSGVFSKHCLVCALLTKTNCAKRHFCGRFTYTLPYFSARAFGAREHLCSRSLGGARAIKCVCEGVVLECSQKTTCFVHFCQNQLCEKAI